MTFTLAVLTCLKATLRATNWMVFVFSLESNQLTVSQRQKTGIRPVALLSEFCAFEPTPLRLRMITTLFDPNEFGGRFFSSEAIHPTVFTDLIRI